MKRLIPFLAVSIGALMGSVALWGGTASAWQPVLSGRASCMSEGSWTVDWSVRNSQTGAGEVMTFDSAEVNGTLIMLSPSSVAPGASATAKSTQTADTASATLVVVARWANDVVVSGQLTVTRPACATSETTTTTTAVESSTAATTTSTTASASVAARTRSAPPAPTTVTPSTTSPVPATESAVAGAAVGASTGATSSAAGEVEAVQASRAATGTTGLPATGAPSVPLLVAGTSFVLTGITLLLAARRRNATT